MPDILVLYHSKTGNTRSLAKAIARGVKKVRPVKCRCLPVKDFSPGDACRADALIIGSPVYFGSIASEIIACLDDLYTHREKLKDKIGAAFVSGSHGMGGKESALTTIIQMELMLGMAIIGDPANATGPFGLSCIGHPEKKDLENAENFGKRVAFFTLKLINIEP